MKRLMIKTVLAAAALAVLGVASAQDIKERTLKLGLQNPKGHPLEQGATRFAEIVAAKSGGKLKVNVFPGGVLGGDAATVSALQGGTVEITVLNSGILASQSLVGQVAAEKGRGEDQGVERGFVLAVHGVGVPLAVDAGARAAARNAVADGWLGASDRPSGRLSATRA